MGSVTNTSDNLRSENFGKKNEKKITLPFEKFNPLY